jgi:hypothetical protein
MNKSDQFSAKIEIIGINPFVYIPEIILEQLIKKAGNHKWKIPVKLKIDGFSFIQMLVKYSGHWRLYLKLLCVKQ